MKTSNVIVILLAATLSIFPMSVLADRGDDHESKYFDYKVKRFTVEGESRTGFNSFKSQPVYNLGPLLGGLNWSFVFAHEPEAAESSPITVDTDVSRLIATGADQFFYNVLVGIDTSLIDPETLNVPFREFPIIVDGISGARSALEPFSAENYNQRRGLSSPDDPISIADWFSARGVAYVKCFSSGRSRVVFKFRNLIPNGIYTVWGLYGTDSDSDGIYDGLTPPIAFGGVPNAFTADRRGYGTFRRNLPICPNAVDDLLSVEVAYHIDGSTLGGTVAMFPTVSGTFVGNVSVATQLSFNFGGLERF